ncbi:Superoxide dismutase [Mn] [Buchnera aphidicola (Tetraneura ulmi)]|uniref:Fe-Mn family superoxide dismutase n=1 Tax=Buchnera aphidicola TaxID=9 RepID=UPI0034641CD1
MNYKLPELDFSYDALEPYFDKQTMIIHHTRHHQTYINNSNLALNSINSELSGKSIEYILYNLNKIDNLDKRQLLRNNLGGHFNHSFFWKGLSLGTNISISFKKVIEKNFGSFLEFKKKFNSVALSRFGSGWVWLVMENNNNKRLSIVSTANQDNPIMRKEISLVTSGTPIIGLDLWEHSYYLKYQNNRSNYIEAFWNVLNWNKVVKRFES